MEQIESEADHAIAKARALMTGLSPRPDDLHNAAIVVVEDDDDMFETVELDSATLGHATTSDAARLADEAARHAQRAGYHRAVADGDELPQQWRGLDDLESLPDAGAAARAPADETEKERKKREKKEAKEREKAEKKAAKEQAKAEKRAAKQRKKEGDSADDGPKVVAPASDAEEEAKEGNVARDEEAQ